MLDNPRARLFEFPDHWGAIEDYHFLRNHIQDMVRNPVVRLFSGENLTDQSKDYHVGQTSPFGEGFAPDTSLALSHTAIVRIIF
ncbi:unnamed protein product [Allacma fusca]|uniref:Uncharacterized protein n=1 Tax=Allacma fusca TaxID=39272 RepID=A0A8J2L8N8_9HEXA|nr:unnamed protein product [Allacma fusca]